MPHSRYIHPENWGEIEKGYFFQAAMYYLSDTEQPLKFLMTDENGNLSVEERHGNFDSIIGPNGRPSAVEQDVVVTVKPRQVVILSNNNVNQSERFKYVQVAPVFGIKGYETKKPWYEDLKDDSLEGFVFVPKGRNGIAIDLTQISTIHKSLLLEKQDYLRQPRMDFLESQLLDQLDIE
ncbi:hypothetical protein [Halobacillus seohaensis]|uniref:Uncharacterized protein n=1 Tax=Halobacillus seohaensis TaxID=447421 RepID=A0ABW2ERC3_9BACI